MLATTKPHDAILPIANSQRLAAAFFAAILGLFLLYGAGFAQADMLHNAAHDARHAVGFPCH